MMARRIGILVLVATAAVVALAGTGSAQDAQAQLNCQQGPEEITPLGAPGQWDCTATVQFPQAGDPANFYSISLQDADSPSWANVIISPASVTGRYSGQEATNTHNFQISVALTQNAPAFQSTSVTIDGSAQSSSQNINVAPTQITVTPGYFNLYNVRLDKKIGQGGPQDNVEFPILIDNFSNGETRFDFSLTAPDNVPAGFQPVIPEPTVLQSQAGGGEQTQGNVLFSVYTPYQNGYVNEVGAIQLTVDSSYAPDTSIKGASSQVSTLTQARGFYVPGPGAGLAALAIVGAALSMGAVVRRD